MSTCNTRQNYDYLLDKKKLNVENVKETTINISADSVEKYYLHNHIINIKERF